MLYSSCKSPFIDELENIYQLKINKKVRININYILHLLHNDTFWLQLEIDNDDVINEKYLLDELYPQKDSDKPKFDKPKAPGRGVRRIIKPSE